MKFTVAGPTPPPSGSVLFEGETGNSILGLYSMPIYRAQELETFQASVTTQHIDPWTPTRLSENAMELLELDRAVSERELMESQDDNNNGNQEELLSILPEEQFFNKAKLLNSDRDGGGASDQMYDDSLDLEEGTVVGSGSRDDLWQVMMVQAQTFQELADEVVSL
ncbi:hypothetical protein BGZ96_001922 [Linnemannia gamsii]|uniref:Uncharacterized protein n=1 Tax=Linnemannia gamsii TaxID=64522 RepID=A0ABQ7K9X5_9FUNG|nr:hypothetical protein BGZ96_001922 [Linnemannia gamsii]